MKKYKSGIITILGKPNVGKSSLLNAITKKDLAIVTHKSETTRFPIMGMINNEDYQMVFIDTPGISFDSKNQIEKQVTKQAYSQVLGSDLIYLLVDRVYDKSVEYAINYIKKQKIKVFLVITKVDIKQKEKIINIINSYKDVYEFDEYIPISSIKNINIDLLKELSLSYFKCDYPLFDNDFVTNISLDIAIMEVVRKQILLLTSDEIPYSVYLEISDIEISDTKMKLLVDIICNKKSQKNVLIGKQGSMINEIKKNATIELRKKYNKKIILDLYVKVSENWKDKKTYDSTYL